MTTALYTHPVLMKHEMGQYHPDSPARIQVILDKLVSSGTAPHLDYREAPKAAESDIARVHIGDMIAEARDNIPEEGKYHPLNETLLNA